MTLHNWKDIDTEINRRFSTNTKMCELCGARSTKSSRFDSSVFLIIPEIEEFQNRRQICPETCEETLVFIIQNS